MYLYKTMLLFVSCYCEFQEKNIHDIKYYFIVVCKLLLWISGKYINDKVLLLKIRSNDPRQEVHV
jgi:hypothetical protein